MQTSYAIPHSNGLLYLPARAREWLQLPRTCRLHCRILDDTGEPYLVMSPIPTDSWGQCFRITVLTGELPGSLHAVLKAIEDAQLNIVHMVASATSAAGELTVTAVATPTISVESTSTDFATKLERRFSDSVELRWLSRSAMFDDPDRYGLKKIVVRPLNVLRALKSVPGRPERLGRMLGEIYSREFSFDMVNSKVDLSKPCIQSTCGSKDPLAPMQCMQTQRTKASIGALVTTDTSECHLRLCLLPEACFNYIKIPLAAEAADSGKFSGVTRRVIQTLADAPTCVNIYHATNFTASSRLSDSPTALASEQIDLRVMGDCSAVIHNANETRREAIAGRLHSRVEELSDKNRSICLREEGVVIRPLLAPLVFTATNAKHTMKKQDIEYALALCAELKDINLLPVFLDTLSGRGNAKDQMTRLLDACPLLVSLYLPEDGTKLQYPASNSQADHAASVWTAFEEAYMLSKPDRFVYRLIHRSVFPPPFLDRTLEFTFDTPAEFRGALTKIRQRIQRDRVGDHWSTVVTTCSRSFESGRLTPEDIAGHDLETWLRHRADGDI